MKTLSTGTVPRKWSNTWDTLGLLAFVALAGPVAAQPAAPYTRDANTVVLDHFDGSTVGTVAAYRSVPGCGTPAPAVTPNFAYSTCPAGFGQALTLSPPTGEPSGSATYVTYPGGQLLGQAAGTLEFWVYPTSYGGGAGLATQAPFFGACAGYTFHMVLDANGQLQANAFDFGFNLNSGNNRVPLNTWTHVAVTWGALGARLYLGGQLVGLDANGRGPSPGYGGSVLVRAGSHVAGSNNGIDELRISNIQRQFGPIEPARLDIHHFAGLTITGTVGAQYRIRTVLWADQCLADAHQSDPTGESLRTHRLRLAEHGTPILQDRPATLIQTTGSIPSFLRHSDALNQNLAEPQNRSQA